MKKIIKVYCSLWICILLFSNSALANAHVTLNMKKVDIAEVMNILSRQNRINILLAKGVSGDISVNLYNVPTIQAIHDIAEAGGYAVEKDRDTYFIMKRTEVGSYRHSDTTIVETFSLDYADAEKVEDVIADYLSKYGKVSSLKESNMLMIEDTPAFMKRIRSLIAELDRQPQQIIIEAKILEITLEESQAYGIEWNNILQGGGFEGNVGTRGLAPDNPSGLFMNLVDNDLNIFLDALKRGGRTRTLSSPKLVALENEEASVIVGDRLGYLNTVTVNQVTTESTQFLESGVILRVTPTIDARGLIMLEVEPEVSTGKVIDGIPSQTTTTVKTKLIIPDGHTSFIGGLIKTQTTSTEVGVPWLSSIPWLGALFRHTEEREFNTETIVLITPRIVTHAGLDTELKQLLEGDLTMVEPYFEQKNRAQKAAQKEQHEEAHINADIEHQHYAD